MQLTPNFKLQEFLSPNDDTAPSDEVIENLRNLANRLQVIRDVLDKPIMINSGFRSEGYNRSIGGAAKSQHVLGNAADIRIAGMTPREVQDYLVNWNGGLGSYKTFTHIDIRPNRARWSG
jgi:uncharacterized protein YcbK (DUF882 family)